MASRPKPQTNGIWIRHKSPDIVFIRLNNGEFGRLVRTVRTFRVFVSGTACNKVPAHMFDRMSLFYRISSDKAAILIGVATPPTLNPMTN